MAYPRPPGIRRLRTRNSFPVNEGTDNETTRGACSAMVATWSANLLCGGDPFGDGAMAVPAILLGMQDYLHEKPDGGRPFGARDRAPFYYLAPAGLWTTGRQKGTLTALALSDYMQTMLPMKTTAFCHVFATHGGSHAFGLHGDEDRLLFFEPNFGVYELNKEQWKLNLPSWLQQRYFIHKKYRDISMYPVELMEPQGRRPQAR